MTDEPHSTDSRSASPNDQDLEEGEYWNCPLRGDHANLNFYNRRPLFILKQTWDDRPRSNTNAQPYYQVLDPRTELFLKLFSEDEVKTLPCALVEWRSPPGPGKGKGKQWDEGHDMNPVDANDRTEANKLDSEEYLVKMALFHADIAAVSPGVSSNDEVGSIYSSDGECGGTNAEDDEEGATIYYPLLPLPRQRRGNDIREKLRKISCSDSHISSMRALALEMLDEMHRADKIPAVTDS